MTSLSNHTQDHSFKNLLFKANVKKATLNMFKFSNYFFPFSISQQSKKKTQGFSKKKGVYLLRQYLQKDS